MQCSNQRFLGFAYSLPPKQAWSQFLQKETQIGKPFLKLAQEENAANWKCDKMKIFFIIWLVLALIVSVFVVAALMRSSQLSQEEGISESYDDWEAPEEARELFPRQAE